MPLQQTTLVYGDDSYPHYYLCNYLPVSVGTDSLSLSLLKFKRGRQPDLNAWIDCSLELLDEASAPPIPPAPATRPPILPNTILLRALHHDETSAHKDHPGALDKLGQTLANHFHSHYCPLLLRKSAPTPEIKGLSKEQREAKLKNRYYIDTRHFPAPPLPALPTAIDPPAAPPSPLPGHPDLSRRSPLPPPDPSFLLLDDILTTGTTMKMIIAALLQPYPRATIVIFTLSKADYDSHANRSSPLHGPDYPIGQDKIHIVAEEGFYPYAANSLKAQIRTDSF